MSGTLADGYASKARNGFNISIWYIIGLNSCEKIRASLLDCCEICLYFKLQL